MAKSKYDAVVRPYLFMIEGWMRDGLTLDQVAANLRIKKVAYGMDDHGFPTRHNRHRTWPERPTGEKETRMADELLRVHCPRCGGTLIRYVQSLTGDAWIECLEASCDYRRADDE